MYFEIIGEIKHVEIIATGVGVRERKRLWKVYGRASWRKLKGVASIKLRDGARVIAELHWYEAHGLGKKEFKIKRLLAQEN
jgi:hypothetical protein